MHIQPGGAVEIGGGVALLLGWKIKWAAFALAGFTGIAAILFHANFSDQIQMIMFMKNWTIVGGMLILAIHGAGAFSLDHKFSKTKVEPHGTGGLGLGTH